jgi:WD40 repeat protein
MSVYRPTYTDKKTGVLMESNQWWYEFIYAGKRIRESAKSTRKTIAVEAEKRRRLELERAHMASVGHAAFSPDGKQVLTASEDHTARVWNAANGQLLAKLEGHTDRVVHAEFSPDGHRVVTASVDNTALVWDAATAQSLAK